MNATEKRHTPGDWESVANGNCFTVVESGSQYGDIAIATVHYNAEDEDGDTKSNAALIAASPDLLAALEEIVRVFPLLIDEQNAALTKARQAIAKAKGQ